MEKEKTLEAKVMAKAPNLQANLQGKAERAKANVFSGPPFCQLG